MKEKVPMHSSTCDETDLLKWLAYGPRKHAASYTEFMPIMSEVTESRLYNVVEGEQYVRDDCEGTKYTCLLPNIFCQNPFFSLIFSLLLRTLPPLASLSSKSSSLSNFPPSPLCLPVLTLSSALSNEVPPPSLYMRVLSISLSSHPHLTLTLGLLSDLSDAEVQKLKEYLLEIRSLV
ncbi:uncharacterized protein LOC133821091 [Humulus lupulus]|uniref:uncharacterized protein LOC133821091 n=1 Tax=Humulus lupulus TaxID=3486 RepID=UPI002B40E45E|nr:uncharacterized protein LOC133821091 [Humulus lupulus]